MKKTLLVLSFLAFEGALLAQQDHEPAKDEKSIYERVTNLEKKNDKFNLYLNLQGSFDGKWNNLNPSQNYSHFNMRQLRIEARGNINDTFSYRWRQRLNSPNNPGMDNMPTSIDIAGLGVKISDKFSMFVGKQCAAYGGIEFDLNPIEVYEYCNLIDNMNNFFTGVNFIFNPSPEHQIQFQVANSLNHSFDKTYDVAYDKSIHRTKVPLVYSLNWNGNLFNGAFQPRWSASLLSESTKKNMYFLAFGNQINFSKKLDMYFDVMYSKEGLDRKGIMSNILFNTYNYEKAFTAQDVSYLSFIAKVNCRFAPRWNWFVKGMYETASADKSFKVENKNIAEGKYLTSWGYFTGIEYYPMNSNLHFFLTYVGRSHKFQEERVKNMQDFYTNRISLGVIYQIPLF
ncbi:porin [Porphyromonas pogonae]|uniref:porin n=1 Tax=Porphyromonas pogonae TaxID=867595 RepID=UPI002E762C05|nr:porin [Porphyromonas pogonae]